jgi:hypothetical protein
VFKKGAGAPELRFPNSSASYGFRACHLWQIKMLTFIGKDDKIVRVTESNNEER